MPTSPQNKKSQPAGQSTANPPIAGLTGTLIVEPQAGVAPYLTPVQGAQHTIDVNSYRLTDNDLVSALVQSRRNGACFAENFM